jgi:hypothetical protein
MVLVIMKLLIKRFISVYVVLFTMSFPIHFDSWLNFPVYIAKGWEHLNVFVCFLFNLTLDSPILSDSKGLYVHILSLIVVSALISFIWTRFQKEENQIRNYYFTVFVSYYLGLQLIIYGFNKVFLLQFPSPTANILYTNLGAVSKDLLFWTSMGISPLYNYFMGGIELLAAGLLLYFRTRLLGAILSMGIFLNVVFINFSFDISVKVYSLFLLFCSLYLVIPYLKVLHRFFIQQEQVTIEYRKPNLDSLKHNRLVLVLKVIIISFFFFIGLKPYFDSFSTHDKTIGAIGFLEAYKVIDFKVNGSVLNPSERVWKRVFLHPRSYLIIENSQEEFYDYQIVFSSNSKQMIINNKTVLNYQFQPNGNLKLIGIWNKEALVVTLEPITHKDLPLLQDQFHWFID